MLENHYGFFVRCPTSLCNQPKENSTVLLTNSSKRAIIKITSKYQGTQVSAERRVKREAGENPAQCRCCVSGVVFMIIGQRIPRRGKPRWTLQSEDLPVYDAQKTSPGFGRVQHGMSALGISYNAVSPDTVFLFSELLVAHLSFAQRTESTVPARPFRQARAPGKAQAIGLLRFCQWCARMGQPRCRDCPNF